VVVLETLRAFDIFLPRINFGKVKPSYPQQLNGGGGVLAQSAGEAGFSYLKRDLVRLLGILCYNNKAIQDRVRSCGGIPVVLNLCAIDDRNPCKSYSLFLMHQLACCGVARWSWTGARGLVLLCTRCVHHVTFRWVNCGRPLFFSDLREHALFALRNLLHNNSENQAIVDTFRADEHVGL
jgi:hypothetical protein